MKVNCDLGILYQEILATALSNYREVCLRDGSHSRAECVDNLSKLLLGD